MWEVMGGLLPNVCPELIAYSSMGNISCHQTIDIFDALWTWNDALSINGSATGNSMPVPQKILPDFSFFGIACGHYPSERWTGQHLLRRARSEARGECAHPQHRGSMWGDLVFNRRPGGETMKLMGTAKLPALIALFLVLSGTALGAGALASVILPKLFDNSGAVPQTSPGEGNPTSGGCCAH
jgi:hypothetical protein